MKTMLSSNGRTLSERLRAVLVLAVALTLAMVALSVAWGAGSGAAHAAETSPPAGQAWAWGDNVFAQLGDGTTIDRKTPVKVSGLTGVKLVVGGFAHSLALKRDGTLRAWGDNYDGQLGDGTRTDRKPLSR